MIFTEKNIQAITMTGDSPKVVEISDELIVIASSGGVYLYSTRGSGSVLSELSPNVFSGINSQTTLFLLSSKILIIKRESNKFQFGFLTVNQNPDSISGVLSAYTFDSTSTLESYTSVLYNGKKNLIIGYTDKAKLYFQKFVINEELQTVSKDTSTKNNLVINGASNTNSEFMYLLCEEGWNENKDSIICTYYHLIDRNFKLIEININDLEMKRIVVISTLIVPNNVVFTKFQKKNIYVLCFIGTIVTGQKKFCQRFEVREGYPRNETDVKAEEMTMKNDNYQARTKGNSFYILGIFDETIEIRQLNLNFEKVNGRTQSFNQGSKFEAAEILLRDKIGFVYQDNGVLQVSLKSTPFCDDITLYFPSSSSVGSFNITDDASQKQKVLFYDVPKYGWIFQGDKAFSLSTEFNTSNFTFKTSDQQGSEEINFALQESESDSKYYSDTCSLYITICYSSCSKCYKEEGNSDKHNCEICREGFLFENDGSQNLTNCFKEGEDKEGYYVETNAQGEKVWKKCHKNCRTCTAGPITNDPTTEDHFSSNCKECETGFNFYENTNHCIDKTPHHHYLNGEEKRYKKCYKTCETCSNDGTEDNHYCITCIAGYEERQDLLPNKCVKKCIRGEKDEQNNEISVWYVDVSTKDVKCSSKCPNKYYLVNDTSIEHDRCDQCVEKCNYYDDNYCVLCKKGLLYQYQSGQYENVCTPVCADGYESSFKTNACIDKSKAEYQNSIIYLPLKHDQTLENCLRDLSMCGVKLFIEKEGSYSIEETGKRIISPILTLHLLANDYSVLVYRLSNKNVDNQVYSQSTMAKIDATYIYSLTRESYTNEEVIFIQVDASRKLISPREITNQTEYQFFYHHAGTQDPTVIPLTNVNGNVNITYPFTQGDKENSQFFKIEEAGYDGFNTESPFYHDICVIFDSPNNPPRDVPVRDRCDFYMKICENNCTLINITGLKAICNCKIKQEPLKEIELTDNSTEECKSKSQPNYKVLSCRKEVFKVDNLLYNITFWVFGILMFLLLITVAWCYYSSSSYIYKQNESKENSLLNKNLNEIQLHQDNENDQGQESERIFKTSQQNGSKGPPLNNLFANPPRRLDTGEKPHVLDFVNGSVGEQETDSKNGTLANDKTDLQESLDYVVDDDKEKKLDDNTEGEPSEFNMNNFFNSQEQETNKSLDLFHISDGYRNKVGFNPTISGFEGSVETETRRIKNFRQKRNGALENGSDFYSEKEDARRESNLSSDFQSKDRKRIKRQKQKSEDSNLLMINKPSDNQSSVSHTIIHSVRSKTDGSNPTISKCSSREREKENIQIIKKKRSYCSSVFSYFSKREVLIHAISNTKPNYPQFCLWAMAIMSLSLIFSLHCLLFTENLLHKRYLQEKVTFTYFFKNEFAKCAAAGIIAVVLKIVVVKLLIFLLFKKGCCNSLCFMRVKFVIFFCVVIPLTVLFSYISVCYGGIFTNSTTALFVGFAATYLFSVIICFLLCLVIRTLKICCEWLYKILKIIY